MDPSSWLNDHEHSNVSGLVGRRRSMPAGHTETAPGTQLPCSLNIPSLFMYQARAVLIGCTKGLRQHEVFLPFSRASKAPWLNLRRVLIGNAMSDAIARDRILRLEIESRGLAAPVRAGFAATPGHAQAFPDFPARDRVGVAP